MVTDNGNVTTNSVLFDGDVETQGFFIGDGSLLTGIAGASSAFSFQDTSDRGNTTSNTIQFTNTITSFTTSGNVIVAGNVTASNFYGDGTTLVGVALSMYFNLSFIYFFPGAFIVSWTVVIFLYNKVRKEMKALDARIAELRSLEEQSHKNT